MDTHIALLESPSTANFRQSVLPFDSHQPCSVAPGIQGPHEPSHACEGVKDFGMGFLGLQDLEGEA